jgi:hypothetical protein
VVTANARAWRDTGYTVAEGIKTNRQEFLKLNNKGSTRLIQESSLRKLDIKCVVFLGSVRRLLVTASVVPSSPILVILMKEALRSFETSILTRAILHSHRRENLKCEIFLVPLFTAKKKLPP